MAKRRKSGKAAVQTVVWAVVILCLVGVVLLATGVIRPDEIGSVFGKKPKPIVTTETVSTDTESEKTDEPVSSSDSSSVGKTDVVSTKTSTKTTDRNTDKTSDVSTSDRKPFVSANDTASFSKDAWYLLLVNPDHAIDDNFISNLSMKSIRSGGKNRSLDARIVPDMQAMIDAAKADGVDLMICSAYRSVETQTKNFNNKVQTYLKQGKSEAEAKAITATIIAVPYTSEHHTGLAADIVTPSYQSLNSGFAKTAAAKWLKAHCAEYGFILRYPEDKQDITKIVFEPWHFRYVGKQAAQKIMSEGICLEEFLERYGT